MHKREEGANPKHGIRIECSCIVILNALGYIGFKVRSGSVRNKQEAIFPPKRDVF